VSLRAVLHRVDGGPGFVRRVDVRNLHAQAPRSRNGAIDLGLVADRAHDRRHAGELGGGDTRVGGVDRDGAVLVVEQDPVEPEMAQHLDHGGDGKVHMTPKAASRRRAVA